MHPWISCCPYGDTWDFRRIADCQLQPWSKIMSLRKRCIWSCHTSMILLFTLWENHFSRGNDLLLGMALTTWAKNSKDMSKTPSWILVYCSVICISQVLSASQILSGHYIRVMMPHQILTRVFCNLFCKNAQKYERIQYIRAKSQNLR